MEKGDIIPIKFNGKNYMSWSFHLRNFVEGKGLIGYLNGTNPQPAISTTADGSSDTASKTVDEKAIASWNQNNAKVVTWIVNSVDLPVSISLQAFTNASDMWDHLKKLYHQTNKARKFHLDTEVAKYCHGDKSVQEYYSGFLALWTERDQMLLHSVSLDFLPQALKLQEELHISQFLMNLIHVSKRFFVKRSDLSHNRLSLKNQRCLVLRRYRLIIQLRKLLC